MKKLCLCLGLIWSAFALAQGIPDLRVLDTQNTSGTPFNIPLEMVIRTVFTPLMHVGLQLSDVQYISPKPSNNFSLRSIQDDDSWMELQTLRWEGGLGLNYIIKKGFVMGLIPFKGSLVTSIRRKEKNATIPKIEMPTSFDDITSWRTGDYASFQTYGGIEAMVGANFVTGLSGQVMFIVQNQFIVEFEKTSAEEVVVSVAEENLHKRNLAIGPSLLRGTLDTFNGKRFTSRFKLNLKDPAHGELFKKAIAGKLIDLQNFLPVTEQNVTWDGYERYLFYGIPFVIGKTRYRGHYQVDVNGNKGELEFYRKSNNGVFAKLHNVKDFVYETEDRFWMLWMNEMKKVDGKGLKENYLTRGSIIGVSSFSAEIDTKADVGSILTQLSVSFSREEMEALQSADGELLRANLLARCQQMDLDCAKEKNLNKLMNAVNQALDKPWPELRHKLGDILIHEAVVVHAIIKTLNLKKEAYFKFLSEKFQSLEGNAPISF